METKKKVLVIGAHDDDPEFDAGGLVLRLRQLGWEARFICVCHRRRYSKKQMEAGSEIARTFSNPEKMREYLEQDYAAARVCGADKAFFTTPDNSFFFFDEEDVANLRDQIEDFEPDITLIHWMKDNHYEHVECAKLAVIALGHSQVKCEVYAFEAGPWQSGIYFIPDFTINITPVMEQLEESLLCYNQLSAYGPGLVKEKKAIAQLRGHMSGYEYGESYKIIRFPSGDDPELILPKLFGKDYRWSGGCYQWGQQYLF